MGKSDNGGSLTGRTDGLSGLELGMELCAALLSTVGLDGFHGGVRPDNIAMSGPAPTLGPPLTHGTGQYTRQELEFMAPELFWNGLRSSAADVYSVGLTLYAFVNGGNLPFWPSGKELNTTERVKALQRRMRGEDIPPPAEAGPELCGILLRALAFHPEERWRDAEELRNALGSCCLSTDKASSTLFPVTLAGSPLDRPSGELSEIERMMAEIIQKNQPQPTTPSMPLTEATPDPIPQPEPACESGQGTEQEPEPVPKPEPESTYEPEPEPGSEPKPHTDPARTHSPPFDPLPEAKEKKPSPQWRGRAFLTVVLCVAALLFLYLLLRSCAPSTAAASAAESPARTAAESVVIPTRLSVPATAPVSPETAAPAAEKYRLVVEDCTWEQARQRCEDLGGRLAAAENRDEFHALAALAEEAGVSMLWLGAQRQPDGSWLCLSGEPLRFFAWDEGEPSFQDKDGTAENSLLLWKVSFTSGDWSFNDCRNDPVAYAPEYYSGRLGYVCSFD